MTGFCSTCYVTGGCDCSESSPIVARIKETLNYYEDEYPIATYAHMWNAPISEYARGVTPNDLVKMLDIVKWAEEQ